MIGFNGGLIGKDRSTSGSASSPGVWTPGEQVKAKRSSLWPSDQFFGNVSLLLLGNGTNGSTTFVDSSSNNFVVTPVGNAQISTAQSKSGGASMYFDGSGDGLTLPASSSFNFLTNDFTVEFWMYRTAEIGTYDTIIDINYGTPPNFTIQKLGALRWALYLNGANVVISEGSDHALNAWIHYAIVRNGSGSGNVIIYRNGVNVGSGTYTGNVGNSTVQLRIAYTQQSGTAHYNGYIDDLRVTKGVARYTANFTPPGPL